MAKPKSRKWYIEELMKRVEERTGKPKTMANPLIAEYQRCQRILNAQLTSLGLTYNSTPKKITDSTKDSDVNKMDDIDKMYNEF